VPALAAWWVVAAAVAVVVPVEGAERAEAVVMGEEAVEQR
jgi:hypothetical protein